MKHHKSFQDAVAEAITAHVCPDSESSRAESESPQKPSGVDSMTTSDDERATGEPPSKRSRNFSPAPSTSRGTKRPSRFHGDPFLAAFAGCPDLEAIDDFHRNMYLSSDVGSDSGANSSEIPLSGGLSAVTPDNLEVPPPITSDDEKYGPFDGSSGTYDYAFDRLTQYNLAITLIKDPAVFDELTVRYSRSNIKRPYCTNVVHRQKSTNAGFLAPGSILALVAHFMEHAIWQKRACIICGCKFTAKKDVCQLIIRHMNDRSLVNLVCYRLTARFMYRNLPNESLECKFATRKSKDELEGDRD